MKDRSTITDILKDLAEGSSLHGIPKIVSSKQRPIKVLWCLLFAATFTVLAIQMYTLFNEFYSHPIKTTVSLRFSPLPFPAITFCNMNPVKLSHVNKYPKLEEIIHARKPENERSRDNKTETTPAISSLPRAPEPFVPVTPTTDITPTILLSGHWSGDSNPDSSTQTASLKENTNEEEYSDYDSYDNDNYGYETDYWGSYDWLDDYGDTDYDNDTYKDYLDWDYPNDYDEYDDYDSYYDHRIQYAIDSFIKEQLNSQKDSWDERRVIFRANYRNESLQSRMEMGHSLEDIVVSASFASSLQNISKFERTTTTEYGNCYTMTSPKYTAMRSGMAHGIKLTLNLEVDEYVKNFASGYGVRVVIHEPGTFPLPAEEGMTLSPGYETSIGLKAIRLRRLGSPYRECVSGKDFYKKYRVRYSITSAVNLTNETVTYNTNGVSVSDRELRACMHLCRIESTIEICGCIPADAPDLNISSWNVPICSKEDFRCQLRVDVSFDEKATNNNCSCISPCRETVYQKTLSGRPWPNSDYLKHVLMKTVCRRNITSMNRACSAIENDTFVPRQYQHNFLRLLVYYEDLNFESITQEPLYEPVRFVSDIGGAMGLFLGASLLSFVEGLQLVLELVLFMLRGRKERTKSSFEQDSFENPQDPVQKHFLSDRVKI